MTDTDCDWESLPLHTIGRGGATPPIKVMELDTGATITIVSEKKFREVFPRAKVEKSDVRLKTYTGESPAEELVKYETQQMSQGSSTGHYGRRRP